MAQIVLVACGQFNSHIGRERKVACFGRQHSIHDPLQTLKEFIMKPLQNAVRNLQCLCFRKLIVFIVGSGLLLLIFGDFITSH